MPIAIAARLSATAILWLLAATSLQAEIEQPAQQFVHGSWINVRAEPAGNAPVHTHWSANTAVKVHEKSGDWCHAGTDDAAIGWVGCKLLGAKPLTLAGLQMLDSAGAPQPDAAARAFWVAPSVGRFVAMGQAFNYQALSAEQREREQRTQKPIRFPIPEFDAAKERLTRGVLPRIEQELARVDVASWKSMGELQTWRTDENASSQVRQLDPARHLPKPRPSLFGKHSDIALLNESTTDVLIAVSHKAPKIGFRGKPEWVQGHHDEGVWGIWDVREVHVRFAQPLVQHVVARNGLVGATGVAEQTAATSSPAEGCAEGFTPLLAGKPMSGWPKPKEDARLVAFLLPQALALKSVDISSRKARASFRTESYSPWIEPTQQDIVIHAIDLNADGAPDLAMIEWLETGVISALPRSTRLEFVNIAGRWWFTGGELYGECT